MKFPKIFATVFLSCIGLMVALPAQAVLTIDSATWDGRKLVVEGTDGRGGAVNVFYTDYQADGTPILGGLLGSASVKGSGSWKLQVNSSRRDPLDPVPCAVSATLAGDPDVLNFPVAGAPADCAPQPPVNNPPVCTIDTPAGDVTITTGGSVNYTGTVADPDSGDTVTIVWAFPGGTPTSSSVEDPGNVTYSAAGTFTTTLDATDNNGASCVQQSRVITVEQQQANTPPTAVDQTFPIDVAVLNRDGPDLTPGNAEIPAPGVLLNATDPDGDLLSAQLVSGPAGGALVLNADGSFEYTPNAGTTADSFTYVANDGQADSGIQTVSLTINDPSFANQTDFKIMMNYELGMHCTGFEFAYCCVLPAYNSILAQVVKPDATGQGHPELLEGDPNVGLDALGRETVVRDRAQDGNGFRKYVLKYWHEAQPRNDGRGKPQSSLLISAVEGNSLMSWNTRFDSASLNPDGSFVIGGLNPDGTPNPATEYNGSRGVILGDGDFLDPSDNYQNAVWNHLYFYENLEGDNSTGTTLEADKIRLGVNGHVVYPVDCGAALHPMGPDTTDPTDPTATIPNDCGGFSNGNVLTFSGHQGTVVYTQMKVLENLPIMLTSPDIWEALGLPLTPFEDSVDFFGDPGLLNEDSVRPFVAMKAQMHDYDPAAPGGAGAATLDTAGNPVIGFGTAPIDIPNCERCHSNPADGVLIDIPAEEGGGQLPVVNSPNNDPEQYALVAQEYSFWNAYYNIDTGAGDSDWYSRLKSAAISMISAHDTEHGTSFAANYPGADEPGVAPQATRLGHESVICQRCHADNVIAVVKSAECGTGNELGLEPCTAGTLIKPITEAIHNNHRGESTGGPIAFRDSLGRDGGCQGCHPAHRSDGDMAGYPITLAGGNFYVNADNRGANGGCFVGRDVHSNPGKDTDGAETPAHLNAVGQYLADNVASTGNGIWCTNCHNQLGQEMWKAENMTSLVHNEGTVNPRAEPTLAAVAAAVGTTEAQAIAWLDPTDTNPLGDFTHAIWDTDPGLCNYVAGYFGVIPVDPAHDGNVATVEVNVTSAAACSTGGGTGLIDCGAEYPGAPAFHICGSVDADGDFSVSALDFCTTDDCVTAAQATLPAGSVAVPVPFSAATDGRDHWLSAGEPHCADCHAAPFTEQSGNINAYPPFNYPRKASLMRYSRGHQDISCQGCHESIHGLYPVTPNIDTTTYAQAGALNHDGSHGPLKCGTCHDVGNDGIPNFMNTNRDVYSVPGYGGPGIDDFDEAVAWAHIYTDEQSVLDTTCQNCHGVQGNNWSDVNINNETYMQHASRENPRGSRQMMDKAEMELNGGSVFMNAGNNPTQDNGSGGLCTTCHGSEGSNVSCNDGEWLNHLTEGRVSAPVFEKVSVFRTGGTCW